MIQSRIFTLRRGSESRKHDGRVCLFTKQVIGPIGERRATQKGHMVKSSFSRNSALLKMWALPTTNSKVFIAIKIRFIKLSMQTAHALTVLIA